MARSCRRFLFSLTALAMLVAGDARPAAADKKPPAATHAASATPGLEEAQQQAQRARKTLILEFGARWCGPCKEFDQQVLTKPAVQRALGEVIFIHYDAEEGPGQPAARALKVVGYPTFVALGQDGRELERAEGYLGPGEFLSWIAKVAVDWESDDSLQLRLSKNPSDAEALLVLGRRQLRRGQEEEAEATLTRAAAAATPPISSAAVATGKPAVLAATADWELRVVRLRRLLRQAPRKEMAEHLLAFPRAATADLAFRELSRRGSASPLMLRALDRYVEVRLTVSDPHDRDALNEAVYGCLRVAAYATAERAARRLVELDGQNALYLDTLAEVLHLRGDRTQALALSSRALAAFDRPGGQGSSGDGKELRAVLIKNQARFARAAHELPAELLGEEEELAPWERPIENSRPRP